MAIQSNIKFVVTMEDTKSLVINIIKASLSTTKNAPNLALLATVSTNLHTENFDLTSNTNNGTLPNEMGNFINSIYDNNIEKFVKLTISWKMPSGHAAVLQLEPSAKYRALDLTLEKISILPFAENLIKVLSSVVVPFDYGMERFSNLPEELANFHKDQEKIFATRETALLKGHEELREAVLNAEKRAQERIANAEAALAKKEDELGKRYQEKLAAVDEREIKLNKEKLEFDDRERMHTRRQHQEILGNVLEQHQMFSHSTNTQRTRLPIHLLCWTSIYIALILYSLSIFYTGIPETLQLAMYGTASAILATTLVFYLRWLNHWFRSHAQAEIAAKTYAEDFSRATWLVELLFEWKKENKEFGELPPEIINAFSRGLFSVNRVLETSPDHPVAELIKNFPQIKELTAGKNSIHIATANNSAPK